MRIQRVITKQGHPVPKTAGGAKGPFPPEIFMTPEIIVDYTPLDQDTPVGGTAQNNFTEPRSFRCKFCDEVMFEHKTADHVCEDIEDGEDS
jgi:hypothetical protein